MSHIELADSRPMAFLLLAYNQEHYIREAVEGALSQDYHPLQLVFSDDCSTDSTFRIISDLASSYSGPHRISLNRNPRNLGFLPHLEFCTRHLVTPQTIVLAAGDDVSLPARVRKLAPAFSSRGSKTLAAFSNVLRVQSAGKAIGPWSKKRSRMVWRSLRKAVEFQDLSVWGCSLAFDRSLITDFESPDPLIFQEDVLLPHRALIRGQVMYLPDTLVHYRFHGKCLSNLISEEKKIRFLQNQVAIWKQLARDLDTSPQNHSEDIKSINDISEALSKKELQKLLELRASSLKGFRRLPYWIAARTNTFLGLNRDRVRRLLTSRRSYEIQ